ncbi:MAG: AAA family ATPase [Frankiaceae bacterium]|nr:AAA family ATPase [Frankiaceae bacterium]
MPDTAFEAFCEAGLWIGLGRPTAAKLAAAHINSADDVTADALCAVTNEARAKTLAKAFADSRPRLEVAELLFASSLPVRFAFGAVDVLGKTAADQLRVDPWRLLSVSGVEVREADRFAIAVLEERPTKEDPRRGRAQVAWVLARAARDGHTVVPEVTMTSALTGIDAPDPRSAIEAALDHGSVVEFERYDASDAGEPTREFGLLRYAVAEDAIAEGLARLSTTAKPFASEAEDPSVFAGLDPAQREAVAAVAEHGVTVLHGGPGTGKSRSVAAVVELARRHGKYIALAAPTGRAAKRLEELTGEPASTIHRLLGAHGQTGEFSRNEMWPLDAEVVVVDESSMVDVELAAALLSACADGTHLLLVGDPAQLPSIGPGRVLGDVLDSGVIPATELTILHRQAEGGAIARLASAVREGELPAVDDPNREVVVVPADGSADAARRVVQLVTDSIPRTLGIEPADIQVVTPVHRGAAGTQALNAALKAELNPGTGTVGGFDVGDRVCATANHVDEGFANGEVGLVTGVVDGVLQIDFGAGPVPVPGKLLTDIVHGWALTVHRAQGSEWPAIVVALPPEASGMLSRPLVYTALTRAQRHLSIVHGSGTALARGVRDVGSRPRRTRLSTLLRDGG